jgi:hypothetical protein
MMSARRDTKAPTGHTYSGLVSDILDSRFSVKLGLEIAFPSLDFGAKRCKIAHFDAVEATLQRRVCNRTRAGTKANIDRTNDINNDVTSCYTYMPGGLLHASPSFLSLAL